MRFNKDQLGRAHPDPETAARTGESALFGGPLGNFDTEHADHARMRSLLQPHFSPRRMRVLRPRVEALTSGVSQLVTRFPTLRLAVRVEELRMRRGVLTGGLVELPASW